MRDLTNEISVEKNPFSSEIAPLINQTPTPELLSEAGKISLSTNMSTPKSEMIMNNITKNMTEISSHHDSRSKSDEKSKGSSKEGRIFKNSAQDTDSIDSH